MLSYDWVAGEKTEKADRQLIEDKRKVPMFMSKHPEQIEAGAKNTTEALLREESQKLRRTNELLEKRVKARTAALKLSNEQLEKEISERMETEKKLQRRINFDQILTTISSNFINLNIHEIDQGVNNALVDLAAFDSCDRTYIYMLEDNGRSLTNTHGWRHTEELADFTDFANLPATLFPDLLPQIQQQKTVHYTHIADQESETSSERKLLAMQGAQSALMVPLVFGNETIGFLAIDSHKPAPPWSKDTVDSLKMVGTIFVNALMRKKAEESLIEERNFAQQIMGTMGQGLVVATIEGSFEYVNAAYAEMLGYEPNELIGKTALDITWPEDHHRLIQAQMQNLEGISTSYEGRLNRTDGSWLYALVNSVPNRDRQGRVVGTISTITDLTERRNAEAQIEANAEEMKLIYNAAVQLFKPSSVQELAEQIASITIQELGFDACGVLLLREPIKLSTDRIRLHPVDGTNYLTWLARIGRFRDDKGGRIYLKDEGLVATAVRKGETIYVPDVHQDPRYMPDNTYTQSEMIIPLRAYNTIIGAIDLQSPHTNGFDERARRIITVFAENAGLALETVRLYDKLRYHAQELERQISERRRIERALRTSEQRYKQLVENATDMIYRTDAEGYCTYVNPVTIRTLGYANEQDLIGRHYTDFVHPDYRDTLITAYNKQQIEKTENTYFEFIALDQAKNEMWLGQNVQLITEQGKILGFQALARDITKRRITEEELHSRSYELNATNAKLAKALRAKDEFLANMSHELRTPLNAILGKSEILLEGIHGELTEKQQMSVQVIGDSGNHLLELINDILDMAKIEAGKIELDIQKVSLATVCESSLQFVRQMAHKKQIRLKADIDHSLKTCQSDERRLKQILINLLSNAVKFTPPGGAVGLNVLDDPEREAIQFQVWDTGIGISTDDMEKLFKPFVQLDSSLARSHEGTGLGLSLVYRLTEMHGGSVALDSQVGVGSCFTVTLPQNPQLDSDQLQKQARSDRMQFTTAQLSKYPPGEEPVILLVEDNETNIETVLEYLPIWGYRLTVAHSGPEAIQRAHEVKPDLILMDIQIPELDGLTAVRQLRREKAFHHTPIVALTALAMHGDRERCLEAGANEYLSKPIQLRQLVTIINDLLAERKTQTKEPGYE